MHYAKRIPRVEHLRMDEPDHARSIFTVSAQTACGTNARLGYRAVGIENFDA